MDIFQPIQTTQNDLLLIADTNKITDNFTSEVFSTIAAVSYS